MKKKEKKSAGAEYEDIRRSPLGQIGEIAQIMGRNIEAHALKPLTKRSSREILVELACRENRTQLDLAEATGLKAPTVSVSLQQLEREGYVSRTPDEHDQRATRVTLTDKGRKLDQQVRDVIRKEEAFAMSCLTPEEIETLGGILTKIRTQLTNGKREDET